MIAFRAHMDDHYPLPVAQWYNPIILSEVSPNLGPDGFPGYNLGSRYNTTTGVWTPVQAGEPNALVSFSGQVWIRNGSGVAAPNQSFAVRLVKNGWPTGTNIGAAIPSKGPYADDWVTPISMQDIAEPGDAYQLYVYTGLTGPLVDGHPLHTWLSAQAKDL